MSNKSRHKKWMSALKLDYDIRQIIKRAKRFKEPGSWRLVRALESARDQSNEMFKSRYEAVLTKVFK